jgi:hypothetical protein
LYDVKRKQSESEESYLWRLGQAKDSGLLDMKWDELAVLLNKEFRKNETEYRTESAYRKRYAEAKKFNTGVFEKNDADDKLKELHIIQRELEKERKKIQTEKLEYHRWLREDARDELISERIKESIDNLSPFSSPIRIKPVMENKSWILAISDAHYGCEYEIKDFYGGIVNAYSPEIFEKRMNTLFNKVIDKVQKLGINELSIIELGDGVDGVLRLSQLMRLRYGVIESSIRYADYLATWLNALSEFVRIKFQMVFDSNHNQLRLLDGKKNSFPDENMSKIMITLIKERLKNNENIVILENPTGMTYSIMSTYCIVGFHGEKKNLKNNLLDISRLYNTHVDYTISGHIHHNFMDEIGMDSAVLSVGSIIGIDPYSVSLNAASNASCSMFEFTQGEGRTAEYVFKLN